MLNDNDIKILIENAVKMLQRSYIPYSNFAVGASLMTEEGKIYNGCNIENSAYSPSNCAERTAFFKAVSEGERNFKAIAIVGGPNRIIKDFCPPCGVCRQVMQEFCDPNDFKVILAKDTENYKILSLNDLLPFGFGHDDLNA